MFAQAARCVSAVQSWSGVICPKLASYEPVPLPTDASGLPLFQ
jgi:hypothetical protein